MEYLDHLGTPLDVYDGGKHSRQLIRFGYPDGGWDDAMAQRFGYTSSRDLTETQRMQLTEMGVDPATYTGDATTARKDIIAARRTWSAQLGLDLSNLIDDALVDDFHYMIFPNLTFNLTFASAGLFRPRPHPTNPDKCLWDHQSLARIPEGAEPPPRPETVYAKASEIEYFEALAQDMAQAQIVQQSYHSQGYSGILLNSEERRIRAMHKAIDDYIYGPDR